MTDEEMEGRAQEFARELIGATMALLFDEDTEPLAAAWVSMMDDVPETGVDLFALQALRMMAHEAAMFAWAVSLFEFDGQRLDGREVWRLLQLHQRRLEEESAQ